MDIAKMMYDEMLSSLWIAFHNSYKMNEDMILENRGVVKNIDEYAQRFFEFLRNETNEGNKSVDCRLTTNIFADIEGCFFNDVNIRIQYTPTLTLERMNGFIEICNTLKDGKLTELKGVFVYKSPWGEVMNHADELFSHEMLHAYENFKRLGNGVKNLSQVAQGLKYGENHKLRQSAIKSNDNTMKILSDMYYYTVSFEGRAYIAQLNKELGKRANEIYSSESAMNVLTSTGLYKRYQEYGENLEYIRNNFAVYKLILEKHYKGLYGKDLDGKEVFKIYWRMWRSVWNKMRKKTARFMRKFYEGNDLTPNSIVETFEWWPNVNNLNFVDDGIFEDNGKGLE